MRQKTAAHAFTAEYHRAPADGAELSRFLAARSGPQRRAVTGYDLTFSSEELSLLFALAGPEVRAAVLEVKAQARSETVEWLEQHALAVRTGPGGIVQQQAEPGLLGTVYLHYESRAGDPMLHEHVVISPRVQGPDGRWRNLDSRLLLREVVAASELFNQRALELICDRLGLATEYVEVTPGQRPVMQIVGIDRRIRAAFAQRADAVRGMSETLFDDYRRRHGRQPERPARVRLRWQATVATRPPKRAARSLDELLAAWRRRAIAVTDRTVVDQLLATAQAAARNRPALPTFDLDAAAEQVLEAVAERRTTFRRRHVLAEARRHLMRTLSGATAPPRAAEQITDRVLAHGDCLDITPPAINPPHPDLQRADGTSIYRPIGSATYTTHSLLAAENRLLAAARRDMIPPVGRSAFHRTAALHRGPMDTGQRALAASFALSDKLLLAGLGPAGAGKTTAMKLVASAVDAAGGRLIPLAPSSRAAKVLGDDLGRRAHTLHSWLHQRGRAIDGKPVQADFRLRPGDMVLVDEAGMAGTLLLDEVLADAAAAGAVVRLLGDPHQLAAVEAGGALRLISRAGGTVELDQLHRFRVPGEADASLILRDGNDPRAAFGWYRERGRIVAGHHEAMCDQVFTAWAHDLNKGLTSLMTAADTVTVTALNRRAQAWHIQAGTVDTRHTTALRGGQRAHVGDVIVTRLNRRRMTVRGGRDFVKNGDTWTVQKILPGGDAIVRHTRHRGRIQLPADYVAAQCELGYASTIHRAQGMTVDTSHALASAPSTREGVYVQLTRGARTNRLYVAIEDGDRLDDVLAAIAARRRAQLSATESIAVLQREKAAPGRLSAEFADVAERATTARLTGLLEHALGAERAASFMAADAYPALIRALHAAERAGFNLPRLLATTVPARGFTDPDDPAAVLTWRLRQRLADATEAQQKADADRPLAALTLAQLHTLARLAASHWAVAREGLKAADAAYTHLPGPVTTRAGHTHPAFDQRPMGLLSRSELTSQLAGIRAQMRHAQASRTPLSPAARHLIAALTRESQLRRALAWRDAAREDYQRERATRATAPGAASTAAVRRTLAARRATTAQRRQFARAALARARRRHRQDPRRATAAGAAARSPAPPAQLPRGDPRLGRRLPRPRPPRHPSALAHASRRTPSHPGPRPGRPRPHPRREPARLAPPPRPTPTRHRAPPPPRLGHYGRPGGAVAHPPRNLLHPGAGPAP
ncbi:MobF family relaxase [Streptomyces sp900105245]|uniref:MobF family relaxase n=1 Tax=Streptomyces sp. 900105245 TaxID=3154379 RepID=A0ABV1UJ56_9ACTN